MGGEGVLRGDDRVRGERSERMQYSDGGAENERGALREEGRRSGMRDERSGFRG